MEKRTQVFLPLVDDQSGSKRRIRFFPASWFRKLRQRFSRAKDPVCPEIICPEAKSCEFYKSLLLVEMELEMVKSMIKNNISQLRMTEFCIDCVLRKVKQELEFAQSERTA